MRIFLAPIFDFIVGYVQIYFVNKMIGPVIKDCEIVPGNRGRKKVRRKGRRKELVGRGQCKETGRRKG